MPFSSQSLSLHGLVVLRLLCDSGLLYIRLYVFQLAYPGLGFIQWIGQLFYCKASCVIVWVYSEYQAMPVFALIPGLEMRQIS